MDEQQQTGNRRRYRSAAEATRLVVEYESSGLSSEEFCRDREIKRSTFSRYRARYGSGSALAGGARLVAVEVAGRGAGSGSGLMVVLPAGLRIEVGREFDGAVLRRLVAALGRP